jgi:putative transposase
MIKNVEKSYKFRITPNKEQIEYFNQAIGASRFVFNNIKATYEFYKGEVSRLSNQKIYASRKLFNNILNDLKSTHVWMYDVDATSFQSAYDNLITGYKNIGKTGAGWVKFKSRRNSVQTFKSKKVGKNIEIINGKLKLPKLKSLIILNIVNMLREIFSQLQSVEKIINIM